MHAVTLIGDYFGDFNDTKNYKLQISNTGLPDVIVGQYVNLVDRYGKEMVVEKIATKVKLFRETSIGELFAFYYIAVFSTATDCRNPTSIDWS